MGIVTVWGPFCQHIETRQGVVLHDYLLNQVLARNVSLPIFLLIWSVVGLTIRRILGDADFFVRLLWAYALLFLTRMASIWLVPLDPPRGLIELADPLSNVFYGSTFITKDLFFSGHTSILVLMGLCLKRPLDKYYAFGASFCVGCLLLVQHVHYTIDVLAAPVFSYLTYFLSGLIINSKRFT